MVDNLLRALSTYYIELQITHSPWRRLDNLFSKQCDFTVIREASKLHISTLATKELKKMS